MAKPRKPDTDPKPAKPDPLATAFAEADRLLDGDADTVRERRRSIVAALSLAIDTEAAKAATASGVDLGRMYAASELLAKMVPPLTAQPKAEEPNGRYVGDPAARLVQIILGAVRRAPQSGPVEASPVAPPDEASTQPPPADPFPAGDNVTPFPAKSDAAKPDIPEMTDAPAPQPGLSTLLDSTRADQAGGSAGFREGPGREPWRDYLQADNGFYWSGEKGRSW